MITSKSLNDFFFGKIHKQTEKTKKLESVFFLSNDCYTTSLKQTFCLSTNFFLENVLYSSVILFITVTGEAENRRLNVI